jgi:hypothetical protein
MGLFIDFIEQNHRVRDQKFIIVYNGKSLVYAFFILIYSLRKFPKEFVVNLNSIRFLHALNHTYHYVR